MVNSNVFALSHVNQDVFCARTYLKYVRASTASFSGSFLLEDVRDDENHHFFNCLCRSILEHCFDKLETMRFVSQNHGVSKNNGIYHGFGTSEDCTDAVSQPFFLFMLGRCGVLSFPQRLLEAFNSRSMLHVCKSHTTAA